jgi:hypothetical protein
MIRPAASSGADSVNWQAQGSPRQTSAHLAINRQPAAFEHDLHALTAGDLGGERLHASARGIRIGLLRQRLGDLALAEPVEEDLNQSFAAGVDCRRPEYAHIDQVGGRLLCGRRRWHGGVKQLAENGTDGGLAAEEQIADQRRSDGCCHRQPERRKTSPATA